MPPRPTSPMMTNRSMLCPRSSTAPAESVCAFWAEGGGAIFARVPGPSEDTSACDIDVLRPRVEHLYAPCAYTESGVSLGPRKPMAIQEIKHFLALEAPCEALGGLGELRRSDP